MKRIVILGAGTGGTISANLLSKRLDERGWDITIIDRNRMHYYQPGLLFIPFKLHGYKSRSDIVRPTQKYLPSDVRFVSSEIKEIDTEKNVVKTTAGNFQYDWLISSLGCRIILDGVEGLREGYGKNVFDFYTPDGAMMLQRALENFKGGKIVLNIAEMPIKCPVAPIEFVFLVNYYFHRKGIRNKVEIELVTPLQGAFTKPMASEVFSRIARKKGIKITPNFTISEVDYIKKVIRSYEGGEIDYDLLVSIPPHEGQEVIERSGLGNGVGFIRTDKHTLKAIGFNNIYSIGDGTDVPTSKAGSVAHFESEIMVENLLSEIQGKVPRARYDGHSNCFIVSGFNKALLIDFNYKVEPIPGKYPFPGVGPFSLLKETRINYVGKLAFEWAYWNLLLKARMPGDPIITTLCSPRGKKISLLKEGKALFELGYNQ
jgi:sulfide:quinone oxidoreductase